MGGCPFARCVLGADRTDPTRIKSNVSAGAAKFAICVPGAPQLVFQLPMTRAPQTPRIQTLAVHLPSGPQQLADWLQVFDSIAN